MNCELIDQGALFRILTDRKYVLIKHNCSNAAQK